ncbi:uncharacterized protein TNCV_2725341 [Trichonephila clavipes]|nr:uncharacterized protein TNCV_2725341 [Trichonephila clavipes]
MVESTENPNESFNNYAESGSKNTFVNKKKLEIGVMDAVICFNEGAHAKTKVLSELRINHVINTCEGLRKIDKVGIFDAELKVQKANMDVKTIERQNKMKKDALEIFMQDEYKFGLL